MPECLFDSGVGGLKERGREGLSRIISYPKRFQHDPCFPPDSHLVGSICSSARTSPHLTNTSRSLVLVLVLSCFRTPSDTLSLLHILLSVLSLTRIHQLLLLPSHRAILLSSSCLDSIHSTVHVAPSILRHTYSPPFTCRPLPPSS